jgi:hypothetical protein
VDKAIELQKQSIEKIPAGAPAQIKTSAQKQLDAYQAKKEQAGGEQK